MQPKDSESSSSALGGHSGLKSLIHLPKKKKKVKVYIKITGVTHDAESEFLMGIRKYQRLKQCSMVECTVILVFCPVASCIQTDIDAAIQDIPANKEAILVVMHHTQNPELILAESSSLVNNRANIVGTVDCLFHETVGLLQCEVNTQAVKQVSDILRKHNKKKPPEDSESSSSALGGHSGLKSPIHLPKKKKKVKVYIKITGVTHDAESEFLMGIRKYQRLKQCSMVECTVILVFCPVASRIQTDIDAAIQDIPANKEAILVVMHQTQNPELNMTESSSLVKNRANIVGTVDCLFHETVGLLQCEVNTQAVKQVSHILRKHNKKKPPEGSESNSSAQKDHFDQTPNISGLKKKEKGV
ncbi:uncharacterized protein LOC136712630 [Amia ocellicauda]|uniref:uncharacterized protein LOC136712630 n=1 Tax=Amia ocellicauda TaxID=2972642 RepID=UPI003464E0DF